MKEFNIKTVTSFNQLIGILNENDIEYDLELIKSAYEFANKIHTGQTRKSGEEVIHHCLTVASYVAQLRLDTTSICAALLHDSIEKGDAGENQLDELFGTDVAFIVSGLNQIREYSKKFDQDQEQNEFVNLIFNSSEDVRIVIIRIAEKLNNLYTIDALDEAKQFSSARKGLYMYAPLAEYLGLGAMQKYIEDLSFKVLHPSEYKEIVNKFNEYYESTRNIVEEFENELNELLIEYSIKDYEIQTREKGIYSAYKKLKTKYKFDERQLSITEAIERNLKDIYAARVIVDTVEQCYIVLGLIQSNFETLPDEFSDYIANPKENGYKSIHVLFRYKESIFEVQIRNEQMHEFNEYGPASHIAYKFSQGSEPSENFTWTKDLVVWKDKEDKNSEDFRIKAFQNSIFCFTPKGLVIGLPKGASPLDFAYKVHTDVGDRYKGALVDNKMVSMAYELRTGNIVEIITGKNINVSSDWLKYTKSTSTRSRIRKRLRQQST
jgi:GTP pyrophosphokinase